jgi:hypothetical protein
VRHGGERERTEGEETERGIRPVVVHGPVGLVVAQRFGQRVVELLVGVLDQEVVEQPLLRVTNPGRRLAQPPVVESARIAVPDRRVQLHVRTGFPAEEQLQHPDHVEQVVRFRGARFAQRLQRDRGVPFEHGRVPGENGQPQGGQPVLRRRVVDRAGAAQRADLVTEPAGHLGARFRLRHGEDRRADVQGEHQAFPVLAAGAGRIER